tara:strand:- start:20584 stop:21348 length:765 start_codon:yes stop_codon:yes gene_type:complete
MSDWLFNNENHYIQSKLLLDNGFSHAFFTKKTSQRSPEKLIDIFSSDHEIFRLKQIHSNIAKFTRDINTKEYLKADALISENSRKQSLWIYTADCIPILLADINTGRVAACHAGWRGISQNIINNLMRKLKEDGTKTKDLIIAIGPAISCLSYEVNKITASKINRGIKLSATKTFALTTLESLDIIKIEKSTNKIFLDIRIAASIQLQKEGLKTSQISINSNCTFKEDSLFHSWRRDKFRASQWSVILSKENYS